MLIINKNKNTENRISVKIDNFGKSPILGSFDENKNIKDLVNFLQQLDFDMRSSVSFNVFSPDKILILRS